MPADARVRPEVQLLVYRFGAGHGFEGHLVGALERMEAGGTLKVLDLLVVGTDPESGERFAIDMAHSGAGGIIALLLAFRLDLAERRRLTRRALEAGGARTALATQLAESLAPGETAVALLIRHEWARVLADAVERTRGAEMVSAFVAPTSLTPLAEEILSAAAPAI